GGDGRAVGRGDAEGEVADLVEVARLVLDHEGERLQRAGRVGGGPYDHAADGELGTHAVVIGRDGSVGGGGVDRHVHLREAIGLEITGERFGADGHESGAHEVASLEHELDGFVVGG